MSDFGNKSAAKSLSFVSADRLGTFRGPTSVSANRIITPNDPLDN